MPQENGKSPLPIVTACMRADGRPTFAYQIIEVTSQEADNGVQYYLAEAQLLEEGYEEPFVHFSATNHLPFFMKRSASTWACPRRHPASQPFRRISHAARD